MLVVAVLCPLALAASPSSAAGGDPYCTGSYGGAAPRAGGSIRFGIDPGPAGSAGGAQLPAAPDDPAKDLAAVRAVAPPRTLRRTPCRFSSSRSRWTVMMLTLNLAASSWTRTEACCSTYSAMRSWRTVLEKGASPVGDPFGASMNFGFA